MRVKELIARLEKLDPEADIYFLDGEYGPTLVEDLYQEEKRVKTEHGRYLPAMVWVLGE